MTIWKTEYLKYKYFFGTIFCIEFLLDILRLFNMLPVIDGVDTVYSFWQMVSWMAIVALVFYDFFSYFYLGKDRLLHLLPIDKSKVLYMKTIVSATYMAAYFLTGLIRYLLLLPQDATHSKFKVAFLYFGSKFISIISFFMLLTAVLVIIKSINNKVIGAVFLAVIFGGIVFVHAYTLYYFISISQNVDWTIGIVDGAIGINQYANILPIVFLNKENTNSLVEDSFYTISLVMNLIESLISILIFQILFKVKRFNYIEN